MPSTEKRLIEVVTTHMGDSPAQTKIRGWEYLPEDRNQGKRRSPRLGDDSKAWGNPREITETVEADAHSFYKIAEIAWGDPGEGDRPGLDTLGGHSTWAWMRVRRNNSPTGGTRTTYQHVPCTKWESTRPFGIDHREDPAVEHPDGMLVRLDGTAADLTSHKGQWDENCVERIEGEDVVLSYSDGSVKEEGTLGSGAWHVKKSTMSYAHREYPGGRALSSGRVELLYTLRCLASIRMEGWAGMIHHRLDNIGVVKKFGRIGYGFRITTAADADLWTEMRKYHREWGEQTKIFWVKGHAEGGGKKKPDGENGAEAPPGEAIPPLLEDQDRSRGLGIQR